MTWVAVIFTPVVLAYQTWTYWVFRSRVSGTPLPSPLAGLGGLGGPGGSPDGPSGGAGPGPAGGLGGPVTQVPSGP